MEGVRWGWRAEGGTEASSQQPADLRRDQHRPHSALCHCSLAACSIIPDFDQAPTERLQQSQTACGNQRRNVK